MCPVKSAEEKTELQSIQSEEHVNYTVSMDSEKSRFQETTGRKTRLTKNKIH